MVLFLATLAGRAADWPQWRGPNRDGISHETGLLKSWPTEGPRLVWTATNLGPGYATVSVANKRIFTCGDRADANFVLAFDAGNGKALWTAKLGKSGSVGWGNFIGPRSQPTVAGDSLYAVGQFGELLCLATDTGHERWSKDFKKDFGEKTPEWGFAESPLVDEDKVIVAPGGDKGAIVALNKKTGAEVWRSTNFKDPAQYSSLMPADIGGVRQYVLLTAASVVGVDAKDGKVLWRVARHGDTAVIPTPIISQDLVYVTSGYGAGCNLFKISKADDKFSAEQVYANKVMVNHHGGVIKLGDNVFGYSDGKGWTCQDFKTGKALWQDKEHLGKGSITCADGMFILRQEDKPGRVALLEASPDGYKELAHFDPTSRSDKKSWPHPVVSNGKLFLRDQDVLLCYDIQHK
jgi:hypothetical protein